MNTETVLARIVAGVTGLLKQMVSQVDRREVPPTLYDMEPQTQAVLAQMGQVILQVLVAGHGAGIVGPARPCTCGEQQPSHDQSRELTVQTSVGSISLTQRAVYQCPGCRASSYPLDEQLGLGQAGRMSRYLQKQCGWLLALLPARIAQQTLVRFGWPAVAASQIRKHGEALGAELEGQTQERLAMARQEAAGESATGGHRRDGTRCPLWGGDLYSPPAQAEATMNTSPLA